MAPRYKDPVPRTKKIHHRAVKFEADKENRIVPYESLYIPVISVIKFLNISNQSYFLLGSLS